jgi:dCMP deaminase
MKTKYLETYMKTAENFAELSSARRLHVGAIVVKDDRIISIGYNGMPSGWDNNCEDYFGLDLKGQPTLVTKPEVLHAETNAIAKLAKSTESGMGATLFVTHAPCLDCAKLVFQSGINSVYYRNSYRDTSGVEFLSKAGVTVEQI